MEENNNINSTPAADTAEELTEVELLKKLLKDEDKEVKYFKILASLMFAFVLATIIAFAIIIPRALKTLDDISQVAVTAQETLQSADSAIDELTTMSQEITGISQQMGDFLDANTDAVDQAMSNLNSIDFNGLNQAITDLQAAVGPFARFMGSFR